MKGMYLIPMTRYYIQTVTSTTLLFNFGGIWSSLSGIVFLIFRVYLLNQLYKLVATEIYIDTHDKDPKDGDIDFEKFTKEIHKRLSFSQMFKQSD